VPVALEGEQGFVLEQILGVEIRTPPVGFQGTFKGSELLKMPCEVNGLRGAESPFQQL
jgi:hypothetical protein